MTSSWHTSSDTLRRSGVTFPPIHPRASLRSPGELFAILSNAAALILVHNHPSGDAEPSAEDRAITERLRHAGDLIGIKILDHVVVGDGRFTSFAEQQHL